MAMLSTRMCLQFFVLRLRVFCQHLRNQMLIIFSKQIRSCDVYFLGNGRFILKQTLSYEWISGFLLLLDTRKWKVCRKVNEQAIVEHSKGFLIIDCLSELREVFFRGKSQTMCELALKFMTSSKSSGYSAGERASDNKTDNEAFVVSILPLPYTLFRYSVTISRHLCKRTTSFTCGLRAKLSLEHQNWSVYSKFIFLFQ